MKSRSPNWSARAAEQMAQQRSCCAPREVREQEGRGEAPRRHAALPQPRDGQHQVPRSWLQPGPLPPISRFAALHTELSTTTFHTAGVHCSNFLPCALPSLPAPEAQVLASPTDTDVTSLTSPAPGHGSQAELARLSRWKTFRFGPQNSLTGMFWAYCLLLQLLQQWSPVARGISCVPSVTSIFPYNSTPLWVLGKNFRKSLKVHSLCKNYQFASDFLQGICFAILLFANLLFVRLLGSVCKSAMQ